MSDSSITKNVLAQSLKELLLTRPLEKISVGDICEKSGLNRKSFYYHFKDKYDLVNWIFFFEFMPRVKDKDYSTTWDFFMDLCTYFYENKQFYIKAFAVEGQNSFSEFFAQTLHPIAVEYLRESFEDNENNEYFANFFTDAFRLAIVRWLKESPELPPEKVVGLFRYAVAGVAKKYNEEHEKGLI